MTKSICFRMTIIGAALASSAAVTAAPGSFTDSVTIDDGAQTSPSLILNVAAPTSQTWSIDNNASGVLGEFSIRDVSSGAGGPFIILPGTEGISLQISPSGVAGATAGKVAIGGGGGQGTPLTLVDEITGDSRPNMHLNTGLPGFWEIWGDSSGMGIVNGLTANTGTTPLHIDGTTSYVGLGTDTPTAKLSVIGDSAIETDVQILVDNTNSATAGTVKRLFMIKNDGPAKFSMWANDSDEWAFNATHNEFRISKQGSGEIEMRVVDNGNMVLLGTLIQGSSRTIKHDINEVDTAEVLEKVLEMPISTWSYNRDPEGIKHLGPMSEDFYQAFTLGDTDKGLTSVDTSGVALAAIQGLHAQLAEKSVELDAVKRESAQRLEAQDERILQLELALSELLRERSTEMTVGSTD